MGNVTMGMLVSSVDIFRAAAVGAGVLCIGLPHSASAQSSSCNAGNSSSPARYWYGTDPATHITGTFCAADITSYDTTATCGGYSTGITVYLNSNSVGIGPYIWLCQAQVNAAMQDAGLYFANNPGTTPFLLTLPPNQLQYLAITDCESQTDPQCGYFEIPNTYGSYASPPNSSARLILEGGFDPFSSVTGTTSIMALSSNTNIIAGVPQYETSTPAPISHVTIGNMILDRPNFSTTQGSLLIQSAANRSLNAYLTSVNETVTTVVTGSNGGTTSTNATYVTQAIQLSLSAATIGLPGFGPYAEADKQWYMRIYDNVSLNGTLTPQMDDALNDPLGGTLGGGIDNYQVSLHGVCGNYSDITTGDTQTILSDGYFTQSQAGTYQFATITCPTYAGTLTNTQNTFTYLLGTNPGTLSSAEQAALNSYGSMPSNVSPLVCIKGEGDNSYQFLYLPNQQAYPAVGSDIALSGLTLQGDNRAAIYNTTGVNVNNVSMVRQASVALGNGQYQAPCLSSANGGIQIVGSGTNTTYGNTITNLSAVATGDDSLAIFGDIGGTSSYPTSTISCSNGTACAGSITDSFARAVLVQPPTSQSQQYKSAVNAYPYAGSLTTGSLCSGNGFLSPNSTLTVQGFSETSVSGSCSSITGSLPFVSAPKFIDRTYVTCPTSGNTLTSTNVFCPVHVQPAAN